MVEAILAAFASTPSFHPPVNKSACSAEENVTLRRCIGEENPNVVVRQHVKKIKEQQRMNWIDMMVTFVCVCCNNFCM
jgi:hypothetical protein